MRTFITKVILFIALAAIGTAGTLTFVGSVGALGSNDSFDWDTAAPGLPPMSSVPYVEGTALTTMNGVQFTASNPTDTLSFSNNPAFTSSSGGTDVFLLSDIQDPQWIRIDLSSPVMGFGAAPEWGGGEVATYTMDVYGAGNTLLGSTNVNSDSSGDPVFMGVNDTAPEITAVMFTLTGPTAPHSAALGDLYLVDGPASIPEPATLLLVGPALLGSLLLKRRAAR